MTEYDGTALRRRLPVGWLVGLGIVAVLLLANAHLVFVAFTSQPACVSQTRYCEKPWACWCD